MEFKEYDKQRITTAVYPGTGTPEGLRYGALALAGEAGEIANKVKKAWRDVNFTEETRLQLIDEVGDCLWYCGAIAKELGVDLDAVAAANLAKLRSRQQRGTLHGSGDNR